MWCRSSEDSYIVSYIFVQWTIFYRSAVGKFGIIQRNCGQLENVTDFQKRSSLRFKKYYFLPQRWENQNKPKKRKISPNLAVFTFSSVPTNSIDYKYKQKLCAAVIWVNEATIERT